MKTSRYQKNIIEEETIVLLRSYTASAEQLKQLHPAQLKVIHEQKWFQLFVPAQYHGLHLSLPAALKLEEMIARIDGSLGWTVTLCAGAGWFAGFLDPALAKTVFDNPLVCLAGSGKASGIAKKIVDGYEVSGSWDYATGTYCATAFTANCVITENDTTLTDRYGSPLIQSFLFLPGEVTVHENWKPIGMLATGSNAFEVKNLTVDNKRTFTIEPVAAFIQDPLYQYPFLQFAELTLAVNHSGMATRFLELCENIFSKHSTPAMQQLLTDAINKLETARQHFYSIAQSSWEVCCSNAIVSPQSLQQVSIASKSLAFIARNVVDTLYPYCGMQAANPDTEINRVWRNLHTASQHSLFNH